MTVHDFTGSGAVGACRGVYVTMCAKVFFFIGAGRKDSTLRKAETNRIEQHHKNNEALLILKLRVLFDCFLNLLILEYLF